MMSPEKYIQFLMPKLYLETCLAGIASQRESVLACARQAAPDLVTSVFMRNTQSDEMLGLYWPFWSPSLQKEAVNEQIYV